MTELQLHDFFARAYGQTIEDLTEFLNWPGTISPKSKTLVDETLSNPVAGGWSKVSRIATQVKLGVYKKELIEANPELASIRDTQCIFVQASRDITKATHEGSGRHRVAVDALWLSYIHFCAQSLVAHYPAGDTPDILKQKKAVTFHFSARALLFINLLQGSYEKKAIYNECWEK